MSNPFLDVDENPFLTEDVNPFLSQEDDIETETDVAVIESPPHCGEPTCKRSHRPDGSHYSTDTKERYEQLVAEGKFGPQYGHLAALGRDKRTKRALDIVAEEAENNADKIAKVYKDAIHDDQPIAVRLKAANDWIGIETEREKLALKERAQEYESFSRDQLVDEIMGLLSGFQGAGSIAAEIVDGEAIVIEG